MSIHVSGLAKTYGTVPAVSNVNLDVPNGHMLVLLGPSGCGKTTIMRCIAGLERPSEGRIAIGGRAVFDDRKNIDVAVRDRRVGMVFQSYAIWPHLTVYKNVSFPLEVSGVSDEETRERVRETLSMVGLAGLADRGSSFLSGGQMQRVALARSLVMRPSVLLLDEPMSNLDARLRDRLKIELRKLQTELAITSVYVTHDQQEALSLADQIAVLSRGGIDQVDSPIALYRRPRTAVIADFIGYSNVFEVDVVEKTGELCRVEVRGSGDVLVSREVAIDTDIELGVCVRPGDIELEAFGERSELDLGENEFFGEITFASFEGSHMRFHVRTRTGLVWEVVDNRVLTELSVGSRVVMKVPSTQLLLLPRT